MHGVLSAWWVSPGTQSKNMHIRLTGISKLSLEIVHYDSLEECQGTSMFVCLYFVFIVFILKFTCALLRVVITVWCGP